MTCSARGRFRQMGSQSAWHCWDDRNPAPNLWSKDYLFHYAMVRSNEELWFAFLLSNQNGFQLQNYSERYPSLVLAKSHQPGIGRIPRSRWPPVLDLDSCWLGVEWKNKRETIELMQNLIRWSIRIWVCIFFCVENFKYRLGCSTLATDPKQTSETDRPLVLPE